MRPLSFVLPESFDPGEFLTTPKLRVRKDDARYKMHLIVRKLSRWDVDELEVVRLRAEFLDVVMYQPSRRSVSDALREGGAVQRFPYQNGVRSFGYLPGERYAVEPHVRVPVTDERLLRRWQKVIEEYTAQKNDRMKPVHHELENLQKRLRINGDQARRILQSFPKSNRYDCQGILIRDIENGEHHLTVGKTGRVFNNITALKRETRSTLYVDGGEPLGSVDVRSCQPALIAALMSGLIRPNTSGPKSDRDREGGQGSNYDSSRRSPHHYDSSLSKRDFGLYRSLVESGEFYVFFAEALRVRGVNNISSKVLKKRFPMDVVAKKGRYSSDVEDTFRELFPTVYGFIRDVNQQGRYHGTLIRLLQRAESDLVIETVAADLLRRHPGVFFMSLHDSLFATSEHLPKVEQAFYRAFQQIGFTMALKTEYPNATALSPATKPRAPGTGSQIIVTSTRLTIRGSDQDRNTNLRGPEWVSSVIGLRWPRLEAA